MIQSATPTAIIEPGLVDALAAGQEILCISHVSPDGDAVGSLLGIGLLLAAMGKRPTLAMQDEPGREHASLPGYGDILWRQSPGFAEKVTGRAFDLVVSVDLSSPDRMGIAYNPAIHGAAPLVVIDHHVTNTRFGAINWVAPQCAATCQMLVYLADALGVALEGPLAECLLTGIVTDTLCFRTSNTDAAVLEAAMRLMQGGANLSLITERTVNRKPFSLIRVWSLVLPSVRLEEGVIWATVSREQLAAAGHLANDINLASFLVTADEANVSAVFSEKSGASGPAVECSFRSKPGFDVSGVAFMLGGGGHPQASGCTLPGTLAEAEASALPLLRAASSSPLTGAAAPAAKKQATE